MVNNALAAVSLALATGIAHANQQPPIEFTAVFIKSPHGYVGFVEELPGVNSHGRTLDEAREMLARSQSRYSTPSVSAPRKCSPARSACASP